MAATRWTGRSHDLTWYNPANWSDGVPLAGLDALFKNANTGTVRLAGVAHPFSAGAMIVDDDTLSLASGVLNLEPQKASNGNTFDLVLQHGADLTVAATARIVGSNVAEIGNGSGAMLTVLGVVSEEYGVTLDGVLNVSGPRGLWLSGDSGLYFQDASFTINGGARAVVNGTLDDNPAAALDLEGDSTGLVAGSGSFARFANVFVSEWSGTSTLTVQDGGQIFTGGGSIGGDGDATLTVTGAGSQFTASRGLTIGGQVPVNSELVVENGGTIKIGTYGLSLNGALELDSTATLQAPNILSGGGTIKALAGSVVLSPRLQLSDNYTDPFETKITYLEAASGATLTLTGAILSAIPNDNSVTLDAASGHVVLKHASGGFVGKVAIYGATLEIAAANAAGNGGLDFTGGSHAATLLIDNGLAFRNTISDFGNADEIDLAGFAYGDGVFKEHWTPTATGGVLTIANGVSQSQTLSFIGSALSEASFALSTDGHGGTSILRS